MKALLDKMIKENPVFVLLLGMCPTLAISTSVSNAIGMGLSATVVLIGSNCVISALRKVIPSKIRIAAFIVIIASFVTMIQMFLKAYLPALDKSLGIYIPLIVVNCIILGRAEAFASKNTVGASFIDGLGIGLGFTGALVILAAIRELLGSGSILGYSIFGAGYKPVAMAILPPGGFIVLGIVLGIIAVIRRKIDG